MRISSKIIPILNDPITNTECRTSIQTKTFESKKNEQFIKNLPND